MCQMTRFFQHFSLVILGICYLSIGLYNVHQVGFTNDELAHIGAVQSYTQGQGLNPEHPILIKTIAAIIVKSVFPVLTGQSTDQWNRGTEILFNGIYQPDTIISIVRTVFLVSNGIFLVWLWVYIFGFKKIDYRTGFIAAIIFVFSPSLMSHNYLITFDVSGAMWLLMGAVSTYLLFKHVFDSTSISRSIVLQSILSIFLIFATFNTKFSNTVSVVPYCALCFLSGLGFIRTKQWYKFKWLLAYITGVLGSFLVGVYALYRYSFGSINITVDELQIPFIKSLVGIIPNEFIHYIHGVNYILHRSSDGHQNFFGDSFTDALYPQFIWRIFWFKENPIMAFLTLSAIVSGIYLLYKQRNVFRNIRRLISLEWFVWSVPFLYIIVSFSSHLTIGFRHFYAVLVFIYLAIAVYTARASIFTKYLRYAVIGTYIIAGILSIPQNLSYVNNFWLQPKYALANDSTTYWSQEQKSVVKFLLEQGVKKYENGNQAVFAVWTSQFHTPLTVGEDFGIATNTVPEKWSEYNQNFDPLTERIKNLPYKYTVIDIHFLQKVVGAHKNSEIASENWKYLQNTTPVYSRNDVIWVYQK
jgi:hypothetical protein